jgi:hypothetical protein
MADLPKAPNNPPQVFSGAPGDRWRNDTGRILYQYHCSFDRSCARCIQYAGRVGAYWPIPLHYGCNCTQSAVPPGRTARPFIDYRAEMAKLTESQQQHAMGVSNWRLVESGTVKWTDVVTRTEIRPLEAVVANNRLTLDDLTKAGVKRGIAERALLGKIGPEVVAQNAQVKAAVEKLRGLGLSEEQIKAGIIERLKARVGIQSTASGAQRVAPRPPEPPPTPPAAAVPVPRPPKPVVPTVRLPEPVAARPAAAVATVARPVALPKAPAATLQTPKPSLPAYLEYDDKGRQRLKQPKTITEAREVSKALGYNLTGAPDVKTVNTINKWMYRDIKQQGPLTEPHQKVIRIKETSGPVGGKTGGKLGAMEFHVKDASSFETINASFKAGLAASKDWTSSGEHADFEHAFFHEVGHTRIYKNVAAFSDMARAIMERNIPVESFSRYAASYKNEVYRIPEAWAEFYAAARKGDLSRLPEPLREIAYKYLDKPPA